MRQPLLLLCGIVTLFLWPSSFVQAADPDPYGILLKPIPEKLVVLTFDDSCRSHATFVGPLLKKYGFGGTFYITTFGKSAVDTNMYMSWEQIKALDDLGMEIGNHSIGHGYMGSSSVKGCTVDTIGIEDLCLKHHVTKPTTFCWPIYSVNQKFCSVLAEKGYLFSRGGHERAYRPTTDNPFDAPSFTIHDNSLKNKDSFANAAKQATQGRVAIFCFHGVPDIEHPGVGVEPARFEELMKYLKDNQYTVIAMRDLAKYVDAPKAAQLLSFRNTLPWGGLTSKGNLLYLCVNKLPADRKLTLPALTTMIAKAYFLGDLQKQPLTIAKADTGIQSIVVPEFSPAAFGENPTVIVAELQGGPIATILDFVFPGMPPATLSGNEIRVKVPLATDLTKLAPVYRTGSPLVKGNPASGSVRDFTKPQTYTITAADGSTRSYVVTVIPTRGVVGISNPSFETFDVGNENDDTPAIPGGTLWTFDQKGGAGELGIRDLVESPSAPPAPDGTRHCVYMRGPGNGISQAITFDQGNYTVSFDAVKRHGYEKTAAPLKVTLDGVPVLALESSRITEKWASYTSPAFPVTAGVHTLGFTLGDGNGMDLIDNVTVNYCK